MIKANQACGPAARVREIRTQQTFTQGLVAVLASYYVNIYSPYNAEVFCAPDATDREHGQATAPLDDPGRQRE